MKESAKGRFFENAILLVLPIEEISLRPELSSPARFIFILVMLRILVIISASLIFVNLLLFLSLHLNLLFQMLIQKTGKRREKNYS